MRDTNNMEKSFSKDNITDSYIHVNYGIITLIWNDFVLRFLHDLKTSWGVMKLITHGYDAVNFMHELTATHQEISLHSEC